MQKYINNVQDTLGNAIGSVTVTIRDVPSGSLSTIFSDNSGTAKANPFTNDADGEFFFYAADGRYDIDLTGPVTESFDDIRLLDVRVTGNTLRINTDIATATPPTTEGVRGSYEIWDLDNDDRLMFFGFEGFPNISLRNNMEGGIFVVQATATGGAIRTLWHADPDASWFAYFNGGIRLKTNNFNVAIVDSISAGQGGNHATNLSFTQADGVVIGRVGWDGGSPEFELISLSHGAPVQIIAEDAGGNRRISYDADPDGITIIRGDTDVQIRVAMTGETASELAINCVANSFTDLHYNGIKRWRADQLGKVAIFSDGDTDTEARKIVFLFNAAGTQRASIGHEASDVFNIRNEIHGGNILITAEDAGGNPRTILNGDPDGITTLRADSNLIFETNAGETAMECIANAKVGLRFNGIEAARTLIAASGGFEVDNQATGAGFERVLTLSDGASGVTKFKPADKSLTNNTTLEDDNHLTGWNLITSKFYTLEAYIPYDSNVGDIKFGWNISNNVEKGSWDYLAIHNDGGTDHDHQTSYTGIFQITNLTDGGQKVIRIRGFFQANTTTGGTLAFRWSQNTDSGNSTTVKAGAYVIITQLD